MNKNATRRIFFLYAIILLCCTKPDSPTSAQSLKSPSNLNVTAVVANDGSGLVSFTATAENTSSYLFDYGNGVIETVASGIVSHQYTSVGTQNYKVSVTATGSLGANLKKIIDISVTVNTSTPSLVWADEFNTDGAPDASKWGYDIGTGSNGWGNNELEYYTNRAINATIKDGVLKITAIREPYSGSNFTSARLLTKDKFSFKYGSIIVKAKLPSGVGTWPAIWMMGNNISTVNWPNCGEIDIMEHRGSDLNKITSAFHYPNFFGGSAKVATTTIDNATTEFHIYKAVWTSAEIKIYVDDKLFHTLANNLGIPFNQDFFILLNIAMGGNFGGSIESNFSSATMEIDYVRVYK